MVEMVDLDIELSLIKRCSDIIDIHDWSPKFKWYIACENMVYVNKYFIDILSITVGLLESFLVNESKTHFVLADAIVESDTTLKANDLEVWKTIVPKGQLMIGLYLNKMILEKI